MVRKLLSEGRPVADVEGVDVVAHFASDGIGWLVIADFDCPFEEAVRVHLLGTDFRLLDTLKIGARYASGAVDNVRRTGLRSVSFSFPDPDQINEVSVGPETAGLLGRRTRWLHLAST